MKKVVSQDQSTKDSPKKPTTKPLSREQVLKRSESLGQEFVDSLNEQLKEK